MAQWVCNGCVCTRTRTRTLALTLTNQVTTDKHSSRTPNPTPIVSLTLESHVGAHEHGRRQVVGNGVVAVGDQTCPVRGRATQYTRACAWPLRWHATRALPTQVLVASNDSW